MLFTCINTTKVQAQRVSLKTNALYWIGATPNFGAEFRLTRFFTLNLEAGGTKVNISKVNTQMYGFMPEVRYWFSSRPQAGHFVGLMGLAADYKTKLNTTWHDGYAYGAGVTYGYSFVIGKHWSLEATIGGGAMHISEYKYKVDDTRSGKPNNEKWLISPLKAGVSIVYIFK